MDVTAQLPAISLSGFFRDGMRAGLTYGHTPTWHSCAAVGTEAAGGEQVAGDQPVAVTVGCEIAGWLECSPEEEASLLTWNMK